MAPRDSHGHPAAVLDVLASEPSDLAVPAERRFPGGILLSRATSTCPSASTADALAPAAGSAPSVAAPEGCPTVEYARRVVGGLVYIGVSREGLNEFSYEGGPR